jgi:hypothetical protein
VGAAAHVDGRRSQNQSSDDGASEGGSNRSSSPEEAVTWDGYSQSGSEWGRQPCPVGGIASIGPKGGRTIV